jgi:hypothetical protein
MSKDSKPNSGVKSTRVSKRNKDKVEIAVAGTHQCQLIIYAIIGLALVLALRLGYKVMI